MCENCTCEKKAEDMMLPCEKEAIGVPLLSNVKSKSDSTIKSFNKANLSLYDAVKSLQMLLNRIKGEATFLDEQKVCSEYYSLQNLIETAPKIITTVSNDLLENIREIESILFRDLENY